jgi:hypothetical protein
MGRVNVFILGTGRCGTLTISRAFEHATNFTSAHESASPSLYLMDYPKDHIETDNRLAWMLGLRPEHDGHPLAEKKYINVCVEHTALAPVQLGNLWN